MSATAKMPERRAPRSWLITALLASLAVAYVSFVFVPAQAEITTLRGRLNERRQHILQASGLVLPVEQAVQHLAKTKQISANWHAAAPNPAQLSQCFASLSAEAKAAGVAIERFDPKDSTEMQVLAQQVVTVHFQGAFAQVFDFVRRLEQLPATIWIGELRLNNDQPGGLSLRGELNVTIFVDRADSAD
ncbi:MAG: type 4a pilus biogenesis protein PilO [Planctomycetaceae bacterium]|nr:type 4a pilus biogenesis protein PilO [Planctomycetaceae bacterium]